MTARDYYLTASPRDRRYLLFNLVSKMKITTEGEKVIELLWDVIAAGIRARHVLPRRGGDVGALAKLEGTVHANPR